MEHKTQRTMAKKVFRILFMLLIAVFGIYLAIQFIIIFHRGYKTETAIAYTMADSISLQGVVSFDTVRGGWQRRSGLSRLGRRACDQRHRPGRVLHR